MAFGDMSEALQEPQGAYGTVASERAELARGSDGSLTLLAWGRDSQEPTATHAIETNGIMSSLPRVQPSIWDRLTLPSGFVDFISTRHLFEDVTSVLAQNGAENLIVPFAFFIFASWFPERSAIAPFLWVVVPDVCAIVGLRESLRLLCRHALVVNPLTSSWPGTVPMSLQPTLIAEIGQPSKRLLTTFAAAQSHCCFPIGKGQVVDPFCPKLIFAREPLADKGAAGFPLELFLDSSEAFIPPLGREQVTTIEHEFQNRLARYRMTYLNVPSQNIELGRFTPQVQAVGHSLAGAIFDDPDLQGQIVAHLAVVDEDSKTDAATSVPAMLLEILVRRSNDPQISVADLAGDVNTLMMAQGLATQLSPEKVGWQLRHLGIRTKSVSRGKVLVMREVLPTIEKLASRWSVSHANAAV